jgi:Fe-S-cluster containining protein
VGEKKRRKKEKKEAKRQEKLAAKAVKKESRKKGKQEKKIDLDSAPGATERELDAASVDRANPPDAGGTEAEVTDDAENEDRAFSVPSAPADPFEAAGTTPTPGVPLGPAFRARSEGKPFNIKLQMSAYVPKVGDDGKPLSRIAPYLPVVGACQLCPARCCRLNVKVSLPDAIHYCKTLGVPFFTGMTFVPSDHKAHSFLIERDPRVVPAENGWAGRAEIQLRRQEDGACHALLRTGGYERCGVYDARPSLCRLYPMSWTSDVAQGGPEAVLCPIPYGYTDADERKFLRDAEQSIERWEIHDDVVLAWHQQTPEARTLRAFLEFAIPTAAARMGVDPTGVLADGWPEQRLYEQMIACKVIKQQTPILPQPSHRPWAGLIPRKD